VLQLQLLLLLLLSWGACVCTVRMCARMRACMPGASIAGLHYSLLLNCPPYAHCIASAINPQSTGTFDLKEPYYRQLTAWAQVQTAPQQQVLQQQAVALQQQAAILQQQQAVAAVAAAAALASPAGGGGSLAAPTVLTGGITTTPRAAQSGHQLQLQTHRESVV
jgi:hypothetical protein